MPVICCWNGTNSTLFLEWMVTREKNFITYNNAKRNCFWSHASELSKTVIKPRLKSREVLLGVWWVWNGIFYYSLLAGDQRTNSIIYCKPLDRLKHASDRKHPGLATRRGVAFHQDNAKRYTLSMTRQKLLEIAWKVSAHQTYSLEIAPNDYHLLPSIPNAVGGVKFVWKRLVQFGGPRSSQMKRGHLQGGYLAKNGRYLTWSRSLQHFYKALNKEQKGQGDTRQPHINPNCSVLPLLIWSQMVRQVLLSKAVDILSILSIVEVKWSFRIVLIRLICLALIIQYVLPCVLPCVLPPLFINLVPFFSPSRIIREGYYVFLKISYLSTSFLFISKFSGPARTVCYKIRDLLQAISHFRWVHLWDVS